MKLIYIANIRMPTEKAHGIQIMKMCQAFAKESADVELLVPRRRNDLKQDSFDFYDIKKTFRIVRIPCLDFVSFDVMNIGFFISTVSFLIFSKIYLFFSAGGGSSSGGKKYDILYSREQLTGVFFKNHILEIHTLPKKIGYFRKYLLNRAKKIIVLTDFLKNTLVKSGINNNKILVLPDAVDMKEFDIDVSKEAAREKLELPLDKKIILYTGSFLLYGWKGVDVLLKTAGLFPDNYLLVLVGGHPWELDKIRRQGGLKNVVLIPYVRHNLIPYYLKAADVLVLPNKSGNPDSELYTSPLKLFEYMVSRRPIVSSDLLSLREAVGDNEVLFFKPNDPQDLAMAVFRISKDAVLAEKLTANAYRKVKDYTWDNRAKKLIAIF